MKVLFFIFLLFVSSSLAQDGEFIQLVCSFTADSVEADALPQVCGGTMLEVQSEFTQIFFSGIPTHDQVKIEYQQLCQIGIATVGQLKVDNVVEADFTTTFVNTPSVRDCLAMDLFAGEINTVSEIVNHTSSDMLLELDYSVLCYIWDIKVFYRTLSSGSGPDPQVCYDNLATLIDGEGNTLITSFVDPFIQDGEQRFQFTTMFLEPYVFNDDCLDIEVWFQDTLLPEGDGEIDQWSFDGETQKIVWNLNFSDFTDKYNCEDGEIGFQLFWKCDFSVKLILDGEIQLEYTNSLQVLVDTMLTGSLVVDVQKNVVEGVCCENQLNIETELLFCTDISCDTFVDSPLSVERKESFFVCHRIVNPEFQGYYLKFLQAQLGEFIPTVIKYDSSQPGKLILELLTHIVQNNMILTVISQLHRNPLVPNMGGSGSSRRFLQEDRISKAKQALQNNEYRVAAYEQMSVKYASIVENIQKETKDKVSSSGIQKIDSGKDNGDIRVSKTTLFMIMIVAILFISSGLVYMVVKYYKKQNNSLKLREQKYKESQRNDTEQVLKSSK